MIANLDLGTKIDHLKLKERYILGKDTLLKMG
jgi:hypothetical protein